jgi:galactokinase
MAQEQQHDLRIVCKGEHFLSMRQVEQRAVQAYREQFHEEPALVASAPGRVNLIGEHTDYNGGFVLPCAISRRVAVAIGPGGAKLYSADFQEDRSLSAKKKGSWADYPSGVVWALQERGCAVPAFQGAFAGDVPLGSGLSSSAAIEAATALALDGFLHLDISRKDLAALCQRAENDFVGVNSGIMDQYASLLCKEGMAILIDCRSLEAKQVPLDLAGAGLTLLVCDTQISRKLGNTGYNARRQTSERAAHTLGVKQLRDAQVQDLDRLSGEELKRARHVVTENERVLEAVEALRRHDFASFGQLMYESHHSMRNDYEISTPELDTFVELAAQSGALGARLTGAGFGGCAIALIKQEDADELKPTVEQNFAERGFKEPIFYVFRPAAGAEVIIAKEDRPGDAMTNP